jgi:hypothetical protein
MGTTTVQPSPIYRNFELEVRAQRAEAVVALLCAGWEGLRRLCAAPPAARGTDAQAIGLAWLKASA